jgi:hypothetical protein
MRFEGRVFRCGRHWAIELPLLEVVTQSCSKRDAFLMIDDAIESLAWRRPFKVEVIPGKGDHFEIGARDEAALPALLSRRRALCRVSRWPRRPGGWESRNAPPAGLAVDP